jgi:hypothetical protein
MVQYPGGKGDPVGSPHTPTHQMNGVLENGSLIEWTDVTGLRRGPGAIFRGRARNMNYFHFCIPTPAWRDGVRASLLMIGVKFDSSPAVTIRRIHVFDGANGITSFSPNVEGPGQGWEPNKNFFNVDGAPVVYGGLGISFEVSFDQEGEITFYGVGADFEV